MILVGNQRAGAKELAQHLLKEENDHVTVHELRGFAADNLTGALNETYAVSRGTRCKQYLFSLSLNPPPNENVSTATFEDAVNRAEERLGLTGQPRAIVFHEKEGRRHCHAVWSRIDTEQMKAIPMSYSHNKLNALSRELYIEHGWQMPRGFMVSAERNPTNFTLAEWQQAKRAEKDARDIKAALQDCWAVSDSRAAFAAALEERGYKLAKGDRRAYVAVDLHGEPYAIAKWVGVKTKSVKARLGPEIDLPSIEERKREFADQIARRLHTLKTEQDRLHEHARHLAEQQRKALIREHRQERQRLDDAQKKRWEQETRERQERFNKGLRGLWDRLTGTRHKIEARNERETLQAYQRDREQKDQIIFRQLEERRVQQQRIETLRQHQQSESQELKQDIQQAEQQRHNNQRSRLEALRQQREQQTLRTHFQREAEQRTQSEDLNALRRDRSSLPQSNGRTNTHEREL